MKVLLIGLGSIGKRHASILKNFSNTELCVITKQDIKDYKKFSSLEECLNLNDFDCFIIASETYKHYEQLNYINNHVENKLILVEKPLYDKYQELNNIKNKIFIAYNLRFHPILTEIKKLIENTKILFFQVFVGQYLPSWRPEADYRNSYSAKAEKGGGVLLDLSHELDYIQWLAGDIVDFKAINGKISDLEINSDDIVTGIGKTNNGTFVNFSMDYINRIPARQIIMQTTDSTIWADLIENSLKVKKNDGFFYKTNYENLNKNISYEKMHYELLYSLDKKSLCTFTEASQTMKLINEIKKNNLF
ncbi:MAG: Gfo/Idh/MocA family oxidoreductase [Spirochaetia bacterium]|nr:Gfo/Idh/MocA family oxidoreductase [Spirochaetia bacterium]